MKKRKVISALTAAVMTVSALPILSASSEETVYPLGDVDMDGYISGHDAALLSRHLHAGDVSFTEKQLTLADVNGDGTVDQADADWIHENQKYALGDIMKTGSTDLTAAWLMLRIYAHTSVGNSLNITDEPVYEFPQGVSFSISGWDTGEPEIYVCEAIGTEQRLDPIEDAKLYEEVCRIMLFDSYTPYEELYLTPLEFNLLDLNADGLITIDDAYSFLCFYANWSVNKDVEEIFFCNGKYYFDSDVTK